MPDEFSFITDSDKDKLLWHLCRRNEAERYGCGPAGQTDRSSYCLARKGLSRCPRRNLFQRSVASATQINVPYPSNRTMREKRIERRYGQGRFPVGTNTKSPSPSWPAMWMGA
jgi:hypothetical protein